MNANINENQKRFSRRILFPCVRPAEPVWQFRRLLSEESSFSSLEKKKMKIKSFIPLHAPFNRSPIGEYGV